MRLGIALAVCASALWGQQTSVFLSAPQVIVVSGRTVQLSATVRNVQGAILPTATFNWTTNNGTVATVDSSGLVTARRPGLVTIGATSPGAASNSMQLQVVPSRIEVSPAETTIKVGESVQYTARALDADGQTIEGVAFQWQTVGANGGQINAARMDASGMLFSNAIAKVTVRAAIGYGGVSNQLISQFVGTARLEIQAADTYRLTRLLASDEAPTVVGLRLTSAEMATSEGGQAAFFASLDGYATGVVLYDNGRLDVLASTGMPRPLYGGQITSFNGLAVNRRGEVLTYASGQNFNGVSGNGLVLLSRQGMRTVVEGSGVISVNGFGTVSRYSLNDSGEAVFQGTYGPAAVLCRLRGGSVQIVWSTADALPGLASPFNFEWFGIDAGGEVHFVARSGVAQGYYRTDGFSSPTRVVGTGDTVGGVQLRGFQGYALSSDGEAAIQADVGNGRLLLRIPKGGGLAQIRTLAAACCGLLRAVGPAGVLFDGPQGLYRWQETQAVPVLQTGRPGPTGEPINGILGAGITTSGGAIAQVSTAFENLIVRDGAVVADSRTRVTGPGHFSFFSLVPGGRTGPAHVVMDQSARSIFEVGPLGLAPVMLHGDRIGEGPAGASVGAPWKSAAGDLYFNQNGNRVYRIANGRVAQLFETPPCEEGVCIFFNSVLGVDSREGVLWTAGTNRGVQRLYLTRDNRHTLLTYWAGVSGAAPGPAGGVVRQVNAALDGRGRVMAWITADPASASGLFLWEDGVWRTLAMAGGPLLDVPELGQAIPFEAAGDGFLVQLSSRFDSTLMARWRDGEWETLIYRFQAAATGGQINNVSVARANSAGDAAVYLQWGGNSGLGVRMADGSMRAILTIGDPLPGGGDAAEVVSFDFRDDGRVYLLVRDFDDRILLYVAEPLS
jgi:hypothetical protein